MSIRVKTILGVALIEAVLLIMLISMTLNYLKTTNYNALIKRAETTATLFKSTSKDAVISYDLASLQFFTDEFLSIPDITYVRILDMEGRVFAEAGSPETLSTPFVEDKTPEAVEDGTFDRSITISEAGVDFAKIEFGIDINAIEAVLDEATQRSTFIALIEMGLVALFSFLLGTYLTRKLGALSQAAQKISEGDLAVNVPIKGNDEVADVARAFNSMVQSLEQASLQQAAYQKELIGFNQSLEERVERRTRQLQSYNEDLEAANKQIKETQAKLLSSEKMATVGLLASGVAHEINNPMSYIMSNLRTLQHYVENYIQLLNAYRELAGEDDPEKRKAGRERLDTMAQQMDLDFQNEDIIELLADSIDGTVRVRDIVAGLKNFSRVDSADSCVLYDINDCIQSTLKVSFNELKYHCEVRTELADLPEICCLPGQLNQVFLNLIVNAGQAIESRGVITIRSKVIGQQIVVEVEDTGAGIPEHKLSKIFDPFYTSKPVGIGTGLGLAISYSIVEEHGGSITVDSEEGKGSCFKVWLPITQVPPGQVVETSS